MRKFNALAAGLLLAGAMLFSACTEKETPVPTENTERLDALRQELRDLQMLVYGEEQNLEELNNQNANLQAEIEALMAEIERLEEVYERTVTYGLYVTDFQNNKLEGVSVSIAQNGEMTTATTDANGYIEFEEVHSGVVNVTVEKENFTSASFITRLYVAGGYEVEYDTYKSSRLALFPTVADADMTGMFTLKGQVTAEFDETDDIGGNFLNLVSGVELRFVLTNISYLHENSEAFSNITDLFITDVVYTATTNEKGEYSVALPARSVFNSYSNRYVNFEFAGYTDEFIHDYTYQTWAGETVTEKRVYRISNGYDLNINEDNYAILPGDVRTQNYFFYNSKN